MMKILVIALLLGVLLCGCTQQETLETIHDGEIAVAAPPMLEGVFSLPRDASQEVFSGEDGQIVYVCNDYVLTQQTVPGGDLQKTLLEVTGYPAEQLQLMKTQQEDAKRYSCVFVSAGEEGDQVGRCVVLDDGHYHYVLTAMAPAEKAGALAQGDWKAIFASFRLMPEEEIVSSGS